MGERVEGAELAAGSRRRQGNSSGLGMPEAKAVALPQEDSGQPWLWEP